MALDVELSETRDFLAHHEPFDALPDAVLDALPARMSVEYFRRGTRLIERGRDNHHLYVLRSGPPRCTTPRAAWSTAAARARASARPA